LGAMERTSMCRHLVTSCGFSRAETSFQSDLQRCSSLPARKGVFWSFWWPLCLEKQIDANKRKISHIWRSSWFFYIQLIWFNLCFCISAF
jgi:hypothetical protein